MECDICGDTAVGELDYEDDEILVGCADCLLEIITDPKKPVARIIEYIAEEI